jgi:antitoxin (DNA-binding transcriptional repressor) of toxin-antitoxin stability system
MKRVRISELKSHLSEHLRAAEAGATIEVLDRERAIARVGPIPRDAEGVEVVSAARSFRSVRDIRLTAVDLPLSSLEALRQERGAR